MNFKHAEVLIQQLGVLVVDDNAFMRKMVRSLPPVDEVGKVDFLEPQDKRLIDSITPERLGWIPSQP